MMSMVTTLNHVEETGATRATRFGRAARQAPSKSKPYLGDEFRFTCLEAAIVDLFMRLHPDERKKGTQISLLLKEDHDNLKKSLASLVRMGVLDNDRIAREGYFRGRNFPRSKSSPLPRLHPINASIGDRVMGELHCIRCGEAASIKLDLDDCDRLTCPECDANYTLSDIREHCEAWMKLVRWIETSPMRQTTEPVVAT